PVTARWVRRPPLVRRWSPCLTGEAPGFALVESIGDGSIAAVSQVQRVLLVDDHPVVRSGLALLLDHVPGFTVCGEAGTALQARTLTEMLQPDLIVLDLFLGGADGLALISDLRAAAEKCRILVYSAQDEERYARRALQ